MLYMYATLLPHVKEAGQVFHNSSVIRKLKISNILTFDYTKLHFFKQTPTYRHIYYINILHNFIQNCGECAQ